MFLPSQGRNESTLLPASLLDVDDVPLLYESLKLISLSLRHSRFGGSEVKGWKAREFKLREKYQVFSMHFDKNICVVFLMY